MSDFDASTPQLRVVKDMIDAFTFLNPSGLDTLFAKGYRYEAMYGAPGLTGLGNENHSGRIQRLLAEVSKLDVGTQQRRTVFNSTDRYIYPTPLGHLPRSD